MAGHRLELVGSAVVAASLLYFAHRRRRRLAAAAPKAPTACLLRWDGPGTCFCAPTIRMDLSVLTPSADTIAAFFGSVEPSLVGIFDEVNARVEASTLVVGCKYTVRHEGKPFAWVSIKQIAPRLGDGVEAQIQALSTSFYTRVFADHEQKAFRQMFVSHAGTVERAADAQWRWLVEMWGGPKRYSEKFGEGTLLARMLSKHGNARMQYRFCRRWLEHMLAAMEEVGFEDDVAESIRRYWLHFFGFFEMTVAERLELRTLALPL